MAWKTWLSRVFPVSSERAIDPKALKEDWLVFTRNHETGGGVISADRTVTSGRFGNSVAYFRLDYQYSSRKLQKNGMPKEGTAARHFELEDKFFAGGPPSTFRVVASRTGEGKRQVWICGDTNSNLPEVGELADAFPEFQLSLSKSSLEEVRELHPTHLESVVAQNGVLIRVAKEHGDVLAVPRRIDHFIYNVSTPALKKLAEALRQLGYEVVDTSDGQVRFYRTGAIDLDEMNHESRQLVPLAESMNCVYDGWETSIVRNESK